MQIRFRLLAFATASLLVSSGIALAQETPGTVAPAVTSPVQTAPVQTAPAQENVVGLSAAIRAAQAQFDGGVLEAEIETEDGNLVYEIDLVRDGAVHQALVDARSGEVLSVKERTLTSTWRGWFGTDEMEAAEAASGSLSNALAAAERQGGGSATEVSLEEKNGRMVYEIELATAQGDREMLVDVSTGEVMLGELDD